jgi:lipoprotein NlpI
MSEFDGGLDCLPSHSTTMKTIRAFIFCITILIGIAGCSTSNQKITTGHQLDSTIAATIENARLLYESGRLNVARQELQSVLVIEPDNQAANYYLALVQKCQALNQEPAPLGYYQTIPQQPIY